MQGLLLLLLLLSTPGARAGEGDPMLTLVDFSSAADSGRWAIVNDGVMGGISQSSLRRTSEGTAVFAGRLSLENNGGFASTRVLLGDVELGDTDHLVWKVRGDGRTYQLRLRMDGGFDGIAHRVEFATEKDEWITVSAAYEDFVPTFRGRLLDGPRLEPSRIRQIGFLLADGRPGAFELEIASIQAGGSPGS